MLAANAVAGCNLIHERSGTGARVRIVGYYQCAQANYQRTSKGGFVGWMSDYDSRISDVVDVGNARGADLVTFICVTTNDGAAAVAQQPGRYSCFDPGSFWSAVVAHELGGHNYGCDHRGGRAVPGTKTVMMHNYCDGGGSTPPYFFSNPNVWLNGARMQPPGDSCLGAIANGGDNAYLVSTTCQGVADRYARVVTAPNLGSVVRRWSFNQAAGNAPAGTTITDAVTGTALATVQGTGATFSGTGLKIPGGASGSSAGYLQLPGGVLSSYTNATVEIWAKELSAQNWARLMDFNNGNTNYIMLAASRSTDLNTQRFESKVAGTTVGLGSDIPNVAGALHHYAIVYASTGAATGRWTWYRDGDEIAFLDVAYALSSLQDVNNWLGRSAYAGDAFANCEYQEVRISNIAMSRDQVAANVRLGPNRQTMNANLTADDPVGSASFNAAGLWSDGLAPSAGKNYETYGFRLRTPADGTSRTFAGQSLKVTGGSLAWKGTSGSTTTINDLTLLGTGGELLNAGSGTWTLAGNLKPEADETQVRAANGAINLSANLSGSGSLLCLNNTVTLSGTNTNYTGKITVGDGRFSAISLDSEARLGGNPATFSAGHLTLNRGILYNTGNVVIDDANRGIRIAASAGIFNVAPGTTLTLAVPVAGTTSGDTLLTAPIFPNPVSGMFIKDNTGTLVLTNPNNSHVGEIIISGGELRLDGAGRFNNGDTPMPVVINGTLNLNTTGNQNFGGVISGAGTFLKNSTGMTTLLVANTFTGPVTVNGGTLYANTGNAATNRALSYVSGITVNSGGTLRSSANALFGWDGTQEKPITVHAGGTLLADGGATGDVGVGTVTLNGGTLASTAAGPAWGSWRFDNATDKLAVTADSTASATNVKFGDANAAIEVAGGKTLNFTGTITNATSGGISYLRKTGPGTLVMAGTNTYTGATAVDAGKLVVNGDNSAATGTLTVAGGATLGGNGKIGGTVTVNAGGRHALAVGATPANQVTRVIGGALNLTAVGDILDLTAVSPPSAGSYTLVTATGGITGTFGDTVVNMTGITGGAVAVAGNSLVLTVSPTSAYSVWAAAKGLTASNNGPAQDPEFDGIANVLEFVLGSDPLASDTNKLPALTTDATNFIFTFNRSDESEAEVILTFQYGSTASEWTDLAIGAASSGPAAVTENSTSPDTVVVTLPTSSAADGKLLGRLKAVK